MGYLKLVLTILITVVSTPMITANEASSSLVIASHCSSMCGNVTIPYPFGTRKGCYFADPDNFNDYPMMRVKCNYTANPPQLTLGDNVPISSISLKEGEIRVNLRNSFNCYSQGKSTKSYTTWANLITFTISSTKNMLVATGCDTHVWFTGIRHGEKYYTGCMTKCDNLNTVTDNQCNGVGCCEASLPDGVTNITTTVSSFENHTSVPFNPCSVAFPVASDAFMFLRENLTQKLGYYLDYPLLPVIFNWGIGRRSCLKAQEQGSCLCKNNTVCSDLAPAQVGYRCECKDGFTGNPYLPQGCQGNYFMALITLFIIGSYNCKCLKGYHGNGTRTHGCISSSKTWLTPVIITWKRHSN